jgi:hypothetical protein
LRDGVDLVGTRQLLDLLGGTEVKKAAMPADGSLLIFGKTSRGSVRSSGNSAIRLPAAFLLIVTVTVCDFFVLATCYAGSAARFGHVNYLLAETSC